METDKFELSIGDLGVTTTQNRGHSVEELAEWLQINLFL